MNIEEALKLATDRVRIKAYGYPRCYQVDEWIPQQETWKDGRLISNRVQALRSAWCTKVEIALRMLNVENAALKAVEAQVHEYPRDWRHVVREKSRVARRPIANSQQPTVSA